jgi:hypothetical protein
MTDLAQERERWARYIEEQAAKLGTSVDGTILRAIASDMRADLAPEMETIDE